MDFQVQGLWRNLTWGCATAGRPSIQLVLSDTSTDKKQNKSPSLWSLETVIEAIEEPLESIRILHIHSASLQDGQITSIGDPLEYNDIYPLVTHTLEELEYRVIIHLNNKTDISMMDPRANIVLVPVMPHMGEPNKNYWANLDYLSDDDELLFVVRTEKDYLWMKEQIECFRLEERFIVNMSVDNVPHILKKWGKKIIQDSIGAHLIPVQPYLPIEINQNKIANSPRK